jgi:flagellar FliL protein
MATSPTVLAGASTSSPPASPLVPEAAKIPVVPLLIAVVVGVVIATLGVGAVVYYLARTGRLPMLGRTAQKVEVDVPVTAHLMVLEPLLVNLADASGSSYLRIAMTLRIADVADKKDPKAKDEKSKENNRTGDEDGAAARDTVLTVLGQQNADGLLAADGKAHLKAELKKALTEHNADLKVMDVFFTDFLVQR